jgi:hypothetical protein
MATHGFRLDAHDMSMLTAPSDWSRLFGNCMSPPVVGAVILGCMAFMDFGEGREHLTAPAPQMPLTPASSTILISFGGAKGPTKVSASRARRVRRLEPEESASSEEGSTSISLADSSSD